MIMQWLYGNSATISDSTGTKSFILPITFTKCIFGNCGSNVRNGIMHTYYSISETKSSAQVGWYRISSDSNTFGPTIFVIGY